MITFGTVSAQVLIFLSKHNPAIFSVPSGTENLNKSVQGRLQAKIIPTYCTCLTTTFILTSEQPKTCLKIPSYVFQMILLNQRVA